MLVYPNTVGRSYVLWLGQSLLQRLTEKGLIEDGQIVEPPSTGCLDFQLVAGKTDDELIREALRWEHDTVGTGMSHPDMWPGIIVRDLADAGSEAGRESLRDPLGGPDRYSYRELRRFADLIRDRLKQYPTIGKIDEIGMQNEAINLYYSSRRFSGLDLSPQTLAARLERRNINLPGGRVGNAQQNVVVHPSGEFQSEQELGEVVIDVQGGLSDLSPRPGGYRPRLRRPAGRDELPLGQGRRRRSAGAQDAGRVDLRPAGRRRRAATAARASASCKPPAPSRWPCGRSRARTSTPSPATCTRRSDSLKGILPDDLQIERTHDEPREVSEKVRQFDRNLIEAVVIVVLVALLFMEWRSALLVAVSIPLTVAMTLGICQLLGIDLQQVSIAAMIIALGLLVDDPVVAGDAINREMAHGQPRDVAAWLGPQKLARAILYATVTNCVAFLPLLLVKGRVGDFIYSLPVVVVASLVSSRIVSMTFMPLLGYYVLRGQKGFEAAARRQGLGARVAARAIAASPAGAWTTRRSCLTACALALLRRRGLLPLLGTAFFPKDLHDVFTVNVFLAEGSPIRQTRDEALQGHPRDRRTGGGQDPRLHHVRRPGRAAVLALDRARAAGRQLRPNPRPHARSRATRRPSVRAAEARAAAGRRRGPGDDRTARNRPADRRAGANPPLRRRHRNAAPHRRRDQAAAPRDPRHRQHPRRLGLRGLPGRRDHQPGQGEPRPASPTRTWPCCCKPACPASRSPTCAKRTG